MIVELVQEFFEIMKKEENAYIKLQMIKELVELISKNKDLLGREMDIVENRAKLAREDERIAKYTQEIGDMKDQLNKELELLEYSVCDEDLVGERKKNYLERIQLLNKVENKYLGPRHLGPTNEEKLFKELVEIEEVFDAALGKLTERVDDIVKYIDDMDIRLCTLYSLYTKHKKSD